MKQLIELILSLTEGSLEKWERFMFIRMNIKNQNTDVEYWSSYVFLIGLHGIDIHTLLAIDDVNAVLNAIKVFFQNLSCQKKDMNADELLTLVVHLLPSYNKNTYQTLYQRLTLLSLINEYQYGPDPTSGTIATFMIALCYKEGNPKENYIAELYDLHKIFRKVSAQEMKAMTYKDQGMALINRALPLLEKIKNFYPLSKHEHKILNASCKNNLESYIRCELEKKPSGFYKGELSPPYEGLLRQISAEDKGLSIALNNYKVGLEICHAPSKGRSLFWGSVQYVTSYTQYFFPKKIATQITPTNDTSAAKTPILK